jgi:hypothetical protein
MNKCSFEGRIDGYLLGRLDADERKAFEEHYFDCRVCFDKLVERDEIIAALKAAPAIFAAEMRPAAKPRKAAGPGWVFSRLAPRQWALVGAAAVLLVAALTIIPLFRGSSPHFVMTGEETLRGGSLVPVSPVADLKAAPIEFLWKAVGRDLEFQVSVYEEELIWKAAAKEPRILLPEDVRARMTAGHTYYWQVKAFTAEGTLVAASNRVRFSIVD